MKSQGRSKYSLEERISILKEYEESDLTQEQIAKKYGIDRAVIMGWLTRHGSSLRNAEKFVSLHRQNAKRIETMQTGTPEERISVLEQQLKETQEKLVQAEMKVKVLDTMIDIAERQGIKLRKNSGAKQYKMPADGIIFRYKPSVNCLAIVNRHSIRVRRTMQKHCVGKRVL